jgi:predicted MFS family arabinose efflux permease
VVFGILQAQTNLALMGAFLAVGAVFLIWFFLYTRARERAHKEPLFSLSLFRNHVSNLGLITQNIQWLLLMGITFVVSVYLQTERHFSAIKTGVVFTAATAGILIASLAAERFAKRREQRTLIITGFVTAIAGVALLLALVKESSHVLAFAPGLLLVGLGLGVMLTPSVNLVQSSFAEQQQGEISGLSRSVSNLGSSLGAAIAGTILVSDLASGNRSYVLALVTLAGLALIGLAAAIVLPHSRARQPTPSSASVATRPASTSR